MNNASVSFSYVSKLSMSSEEDVTHEVLVGMAQEVGVSCGHVRCSGLCLLCDHFTVACAARQRRLELLKFL